MHSRGHRQAREYWSKALKPRSKMSVGSRTIALLSPDSPGEIQGSKGYLDFEWASQLQFCLSEPKNLERMMKPTAQLLLAGMILTQSVFAQNQNSAPAIPVVGNSAGGTVIFGPNGNQRLDQTIQDNGKALSEVLAQMTKVQEIDRDYVKSVVDRLNNHLLDLAALKLKFTKLSQDSQNVRFVPLQEYLAAVNDINNIDQILRTEIQTQTLITRDTLPSYNSIEAGGMKATVATPGNVNMKPVMERVDVARASMINEMNNLAFPKLEAKFNKTVSINQNALNPVLGNLRVLDDEQIKAKKNVILENMALKPDTVRLTNRFADLAVTEINLFLKNYVAEEYLRFQNVNDKTARAVSFERISEAFFRRSYLRRKYNVRLGAIRTKTFEKGLANREDFGYQPMLLVLKSLERTVAENEPDVMDAYEQVRNWVELYDKKLTPVFISKEEIMKNPEKAKEYAAKNTGILVRANSAINTITGQDNAAETLLMIMRLILADTTEEVMLFGADGGEVVNYHNARYRVNAEQKAIYAARACTMDHYMRPADAKAICKSGVPPKMIQMSSGKSFAEIFSGLLTEMETVEKARRQEAVNAQELIAMDLRASGEADTSTETSDMFR